MYCVKCGVKLTEHTKRCPLCQTPVWDPDSTMNAERKFPETYPYKPDAYARRRLLATFLSALSVLGAGVPLLVCICLHGNAAWSGYPVFGVMLFYWIAILPLWFRKVHPLPMLITDFVAIGCYQLFLNLLSGGTWFICFGLPITLFCGIAVTTMAVLFARMRGRRLYLTGISFCLIGILTFLIELLGHFCFAWKMFQWSQYPFGCCILVGIFFFISASIKPLREQLNRLFYY